MDYEKRIEPKPPQVISKRSMRVPYDWKHPRLYDWNDPTLDWGYANTPTDESPIESGFAGHLKILPTHKRFIARTATIMGLSDQVKIDASFLTAPEDRLKKDE